MKKITALFTLIIAIFLITSCAKEQVKEPAKVGVDDTFVPASNTQLSKYPVAGFAYKSSKVPPQEWDRWAKIAAPVVKEILNKLPDGHADASGPETAEGDKPGNMKISADRAKAVYDSLGKSGISSSKITYRGVGSSEPLSRADPNSGEQRRVTFVIVPK
jgi:outer membrane protein OmpA-like peptidoglycan-associated protein